MGGRTLGEFAPQTQRAVGIIADQLACDKDEALRRLIERAESLQYRLNDYALLVIEGMVRFDTAEPC